MSMNVHSAVAVLLLLCQPLYIVAGECDGWQQVHPEWIFCDDFESTDPLVGPGRYFEYGDDGGDCVVMDSLGLDGSRGMRVVFQQGEVGAGGMKLGFGDAAIMWNGVANNFLDAIDVVPVPYEYDEEIVVSVMGLSYTKQPEQVQQFLDFVEANGKEVFKEFGYVK